jgi:hypothetical protein
VRHWVHLVGVGTGLGLAGALAGGACALPLDTRMSCGDGYHDAEAGEECDPLDPESYEDACAEVERPKGQAQCDPVTCTILNSVDDCAVCGDKEVDGDEECDGDNLDGQVCAGNAGTLACENCELIRTGCKECGNTILNEGEECEYSLPLQLAANSSDELEPVPHACAQSEDGIGGLESPLPSKPYRSGASSICKQDCTWSRIACGYCGDGVIDDGPILVGFAGETLAQPEVCDTDEFDPRALSTSVVGPYCEAQASATGLGLRPNVTCSEDCTQIVDPPHGGGDERLGEDVPPKCCVRDGEPCHLDDPYPCCSAVGLPSGAPPTCAPFGNDGGLYCHSR